MLADQFNLHEALKEFSEALLLASDSAIARNNRGRALYDLERRDEARGELEEAGQLSPTYHASLFLLALLERQIICPARLNFWGGWCL